ncbi:MAG: hypothetical protein K9G67_02865 [Bacteroidales bacterium]|nr:hypothetical protein [Bacteroidales bacterium]MCF8345212.1 hypothetical protein [Bacteroidales bacterium]MCF8351851.1 hypothetical protein [Bacteroidales bacterium]MCF8375270.1 hypothetical protein [Bacteroidales bacterium]MCF8401256.1 hypothetical protein [Bacteroidales bacterium]
MKSHFIHIACFCFVLLVDPSLAQNRAKNDSSFHDFISGEKWFFCDSLKNSGIDAEVLTAFSGAGHLPAGIKILFSNPGQIPEFNWHMGELFIASADQPSGLFYLAYGLLSMSAGGYGPPLSGVALPWERNFYEYDVDMVEKLINDVIIKIDNHDLTQWRKLPDKLKKYILHLLFKMHSCAEMIAVYREPLQDIISEVVEDEGLSLIQRLMRPWTERQMISFESLDLIDKVDQKKLSFSTRLLMDEFSRLPKDLFMSVDSSFEGCCFESACGRVAITGIQVDTIQGDYCLVLDLGGNDRYIGNIAASSANVPVSVLIDFQGDDTYQSENSQIASGIAGIGALLDFDGDDIYYCRSHGLGFSIFGSSILYDFKGNDFYNSTKGHSQASAFVGAAMLIDKSGDDIYSCCAYSQGFGGSLGVGVFLDLEGNDHYNCEQSRGDQPAFIQGAGYGRCAEATDGHSLAGGFGIFIEADGDDSYFAGSFAQGGAYFLGAGLFYERSGDDTYNALTHSQGYAVHKGLACFIDQKGDDVYNAACDPRKMTQAIGGGRDHSVGWFLEGAGQDTYHFGNRSVGVGDMNGLGFFWDFSGSDLYYHHNNNIYRNVPSMGKSFDIFNGMKTGSGIYGRFGLRNHGVFLDQSGNNAFFSKDEP